MDPVEAERELNNILSDAYKMRSERDRVHKRVFESLPDAVQKSLFDPSQDSLKGEEACLGLLRQADALQQRKQILDALDGYERALACVWYCVLRDGAPHWRNFGVKDEWIRVVRNNDGLAAECLGKAAVCLYEMKLYVECLQACEGALALDAKRGDALKVRANVVLVLKRPDCEDLALRDLIKAKEVMPGDEAIDTQIAMLRDALRKSKEKEKKMFGGFLNKDPSILRMAEEKEEIMKQINQPVIKTDLDPIELEAAKDAGLDVNDPEIRNFLIRLGTVEGREMFEREEKLLVERTRNRKGAAQMVLILVSMIVFSLMLQYWLKSMAANTPAENLGSVERVREIRRKAEMAKLHQHDGL